SIVRAAIRPREAVGLPRRRLRRRRVGRRGRGRWEKRRRRSRLHVRLLKPAQLILEGVDLVVVVLEHSAETTCWERAAERSGQLHLPQEGCSLEHVAPLLCLSSGAISIRSGLFVHG